MKIQVEKPEEVLKEMFWLAWQACGSPMGMGWLQNRPSATKEDVWNNVANAGDYCANFNRPGTLNGDYVFGRMMKLYVRYDNSSIELPDGTPRADYQSWCGTYPTYQALYDAAVKNVGRG